MGTVRIQAPSSERLEPLPCEFRFVNGHFTDRRLGVDDGLLFAFGTVRSVETKRTKEGEC